MIISNRYDDTDPATWPRTIRRRFSFGHPCDACGCTPSRRGQGLFASRRLCLPCFNAASSTCLKKQPYDTEDDAAAGAVQVRAVWVVYRCALCLKWHWSRRVLEMPPGWAERIDNLETLSRSIREQETP